MKRAPASNHNTQPLANSLPPVVKHVQGRLNLRDLNRLDRCRYPFLLESTALAEHEQTSGSYDILFAFPQSTLTLDASLNLSLDGNIQQGDFLQALDKQWIASRHGKQTHGQLPFSGGWFLYLGYELAQQVETRLQLPMPGDGFPVATAVRIPAAVIYDHDNDETILLAEAGQGILLETMQADLLKCGEPGENKASPPTIHVLMAEQDPQGYIHAADRVKKYIMDGDVFQVNLSRRWMGNRPSHTSTLQIYESLSENNPAPFSGVMHFPFGDIISSSPERLLKVKNRIAETRPIAGTRPRSHNQENDQAFRHELMAHPKERAEHIMLIDLERNDLGRICRPGTIRVNEMMVTESYAHVHHIVSNITGTLRDGISPGEAIRAVFPGGTITGCPKERCMDIIAELEQEARGAYTGSAGYLNHNGDMDLNILIRTMTLTDNHICLRTGAGLVFDSVAENELQETRHKAKGLLLALGALLEQE